jgi:hypothetical protein
MDEEAMIIEQIQAARHRLKINQQDQQELKFERIKYENELREVEQALLDYLNGNGLVKTERVTLSESEAVEVEDISAVPGEYIRTKLEVNKSLIQKERPIGNWYTIKKSPKITIKK